MSTIYSKLRYVYLITAVTTMATFISCSNDDDNNNPVPTTKEHYVLLSSTSPKVPGYMTVYDKMPTGEIASNIKENSLSVQGRGLYFFGKYVFQRVAKDGSSPTDGIQRYIVNDTGQLVKNGFLACVGSNMYIHSNELGFYFDAGKALLKIQIFNPTTMQRTGEIDLSAIRDTEYEFQSVGGDIIVSKENKLYVGITYGSMKGKGLFLIDPALGFADLAVIDIPTKKYEKTIRCSTVSYLGYPGNHNQMWTKGDDGALYFCSHGLSPKGASGSAIVRIKKGETDFDPNFIIKADDYTVGTTFGTVAVKNGKLYTAIGATPLQFKTLITADDYSYYEFDLKSNAKGKKINAIPNTKYAYVSGQSIINIDNELYFNIVNNSGLNAYYKLKGNTAKQVFNVKKGGRIVGFARLTE